MDYMDKIFSHIEKKREAFEILLKAERNPSSGSGEGPKRALDWIVERLRKTGALIEPLVAGQGGPPVLRAVLGNIRDKKTILVYAHLNPSCRDKELPLFGNGMVDARGPLLCLISAIDAYIELKIQLPVNLRFVVEAMMEKDSSSFKGFLDRFSGSLFTGVDYITVLDNRPNCFYGIKPLLCWGLRGICKFEVRIDCAKRNLSSGDNGGAIQEAMACMIRLFSNMVNLKGDILIPGVNNDISSLTPQEEQDYHKASFNIARYKSVTGANVLLHKEDKKRVLMHMTRFPSLSIHSIRPSDESSNGDIPGSVIGTFSIRIVPLQNVSSVQECVVNFLNKTMDSMYCTNKYTISMTESSPPWEVNPRDPNIQACMKALKRTYKEEAELVREGGTVPILHDLQDASGRNVLMLPIGRAKCHSPNMSESNIFTEGVKTICAYFHEVSR